MKLIYLILVSSLLLVSCSKVTLENYDQLKVGMTYEEVTNIMGTPDSCNEKLGSRGCIWGDSDGTHIKTRFVGDTAVFFSHEKLP